MKQGNLSRLIAVFTQLIDVPQALRDLDRKSQLSSLELQYSQVADIPALVQMARSEATFMGRSDFAMSPDSAVGDGPALLFRPYGENLQWLLAANGDLEISVRDGVSASHLDLLVQCVDGNWRCEVIRAQALTSQMLESAHLALHRLQPDLSFICFAGSSLRHDSLDQRLPA